MARSRSLNVFALQIVEKIKLQLQTFLDVEDDMWRAMALAMAKMFANCVTTADPVFRNQCMLRRLMLVIVSLAPTSAQ